MSKIHVVIIILAAVLLCGFSRGYRSVSLWPEADCDVAAGMLALEEENRIAGNTQKAILKINCEPAIVSDVTIPANITTRFTAGSRLWIRKNVTIKINGDIELQSD